MSKIDIWEWKWKREMQIQSADGLEGKRRRQKVRWTRDRYKCKRRNESKNQRKKERKKENVCPSCYCSTTSGATMAPSASTIAVACRVVITCPISTYPVGDCERYNIHAACTSGWGIDTSTGHWRQRSTSVFHAADSCARRKKQRNIPPDPSERKNKSCAIAS